MTIEATMRGQIARAYGQRSWEGRQNPLVTIGLSHEVLSLGIPDEQLFVIVQRHIRQLIAAKHPDQSFNTETSEIAEERQLISDALELLDDQETFSKALGEFRAIKSQERAEITTLRSSLKAAQGQIEGLNTQLAELGVTKHELDRKQGELDRRQMEEKPMIPRLTELMHTAEGRRERWYGLYKERNKNLRDLMSFIYWNQGYFISQAYGFKAGNVRPTLFSEAKILSLVDFHLYAIGDRKQSIDQKIATVPESIQLEYSERRLMLREEAARLGKKIRVACSFQEIPINNGIIKNEFEMKEHVIGSMRSSDAIIRTSLKTSQLPELFVLRNLVPFLIPGSRLVSVYPRELSEMKNFDQLEGLLQRPIVRKVGPLFRSNKIILRVV